MDLQVKGRRRWCKAQENTHSESGHQVTSSPSATAPWERRANDVFRPAPRCLSLQVASPTDLYQHFQRTSRQHPALFTTTTHTEDSGRRHEEGFAQAHAACPRECAFKPPLHSPSSLHENKYFYHLHKKTTRDCTCSRHTPYTLTTRSSWRVSLRPG